MGWGLESLPMTYFWISHLGHFLQHGNTDSAAGATPRSNQHLHSFILWRGHIKFNPIIDNKQSHSTNRAGDEERDVVCGILRANINNRALRWKATSITLTDTILLLYRVTGITLLLLLYC